MIYDCDTWDVVSNVILFMEEICLILSGLEIKKHIGKKIIIEPFDEKRLNPNSYNLRLHNELLIYEEKILDMKKPNKARSIIIPEEGLVLDPGIVFGKDSRIHKNRRICTNAGRTFFCWKVGTFIHATAGLVMLALVDTGRLKYSAFSRLDLSGD